MSHWQSRTKIDAADRSFSKFIRQRDGRCRRCGMDGRIGRLECSHFWGRARESTRFDQENADALCVPCHQFFETEKHEGGEYWEWKLIQLGQERFDRLRVRAHTYCKKDRKLMLIQIKALLRELDKSEGPVGGKA